MSKWQCRSRSEDGRALEGRRPRVGQRELQEEAGRGGGNEGQAKAVRTGDMGPDRCGNNREWAGFALARTGVAPG